MDCRPVPCEDLVEIDRGLWKYLPTNVVFGPEQIHPSKDSSCHVCLGLSDGRSICAYIQTNM